MRFDARPESIIFVGVTGGSCAGKSTFAQRLRAELGLEYCQIVCQDSYYFDQSAHLDRDCPDSIDFALLYSHLLRLHRGEPIDVPIYDLAARRRLSACVPLLPADIILVEGAFILRQPEIRALLTESIFVDVPEPVRLDRRIKRDAVERGCTPEALVTHFYDHVKPLHDRFIAPIQALATYQVFDEATTHETITDLVDKLGIDS